MVEEEMSKEKIGTTQKVHDVTGIESFAGLVISFYKVSSITA